MTEYLRLLESPAIPTDMSPEFIYQNACIGAVAQLSAGAEWKELGEAALRAANPEIRRLSLIELQNAALRKNRGAVSVLFDLMLSKNFPPAAEIIRKYDLNDENPKNNCAKYLLFGNEKALRSIDPDLFLLTDFYFESEKPLQTRLAEAGEKWLPNWVLLIRYFTNASEENYDAILRAYPNFSVSDKKLLLKLSGNSALPAELFLVYDDEPLKEYCVTNGILPQKEVSLYYFLTEQWKNYEESDVEYRNIRSAYETGTPERQRRLVMLSRKSGHNGWLQNVESAVLSEKRNAFGFSDWKLLISAFKKDRKTDRLWELLPKVPPIFVEEIISYLNETGFEPETDEEKTFYNEISTLSKGLTVTIPTRSIRASENGAVTAFTAGKTYTAAAFEDHTLRLWDNRNDVTPSFKRTADKKHLKLRISHNSKYLLSYEGTDSLSVIEIPSFRTIKQLTSLPESIHGIYFRKDDRRFYTIGFSGVLRVYSFPSCVPIDEFNFGMRDCFLSSYDPEEDIFIGVDFDGTLYAFHCGLKRVISIFTNEDPIKTCVDTFGNDRFTFKDAKGNLSTLNIQSGRFLTRACLPESVGVPKKLAEYTPGEISFLITQKGSLEIVRNTDGETIHTLFPDGNLTPILFFEIIKDQNILFTIDAAGEFRAYDLRLLHWMLEKSNENEHPSMKDLDEYGELFNEPVLWKAVRLLKCLTQWRKRFDIEVDYDFE